MLKTTARLALPLAVAASAALADPKPYDDVIKDDAVTDAGLFTTHVVGDKLYFELKPEIMGKDLLWVTSVDSTSEGFSYAGMPVQDRVVRFEQRGDRVLLRDIRFGVRSLDGDDGTNKAVRESSIAPIIQAIDVAAYGKDKSVVIDATD
ncbi:MAG: DUF5118 domain-containing protein, partial [Planctomycetota bacterium]